MKKNRTLWSAVVALCIYSIFSLTGCGAYELPEPVVGANDDDNCFISLRMPGNFSTRGMSDAAESTIDKKKLYFLVFKEVSPGVEEYAYSAPIKGEPQISGDIARYSVSLVENAPGDESKYRLVIIANHQVALPAKGTSKDVFLKTLVYNISNSTTPTPADLWDTNRFLPMWGEVTETFKVEKDVSGTIPAKNAKLLRSIAKIDVGLDYTNPNTNTDNDVNGVSNFKLASVRVYGTNNKGYVAPLPTANFDGTAVEFPSIPDDVTTNDFTNPLVFETAIDPSTSKPKAVDIIANEIYIPEIKNATDEKDRHCLVIGGYYAGSTKVSYYRVNFENKLTDKQFNYVLRNYQYRVNIKEVSGEGHDNPENALAAGPANILVEFIKWNDQTVHMQVSGRYFLGVSARNLKFGTAAGKDAAPGSVAYLQGHNEITFDTNLKPDYFNNMILHYGGSQINLNGSTISETNPQAIGDTPFEIIELKDKWIKFRTKTTNTGAPIVEKIKLEIPLTKILFEVELSQEFFNPNFSINCHAEVFGIAIKNTPLNESNYVEFTAIADDPSAIPEGYTVHLKSNTENGMWFEGSGTFAAGAETTKIKMYGKGTPLQIMPTKLTIASEATSNPFSCEFKVRVALKPKRILIINDDAPDSPYNFGANSTTGTLTIGGRILYNTMNFGDGPHQSYVPIQGIDIQIGVISWASLNPLKVDLETVLNTNSSDPLKKIDILVTTYATTLNGEAGAAIEKFVRAGGVLLYFQQLGEPTDSNTASYNENFKFLSRLFGDAGHNPAKGHDADILQGVGAAAGIYNGITYPAITPDQPHRIYGKDRLPNDNDVIINGPFGDMRNKHWGQDASHTSGFVLTDDQKSKVIEYCNMMGTTGNATSPVYKDVCPMFRMKDFNVFYVGDGGFTSQPLSYALTDAVPTAYPFTAEVDPRNPEFCRPAPKPNYGGGADLFNPGLTQRTVWNSHIFCNIITWACEAAEYEWNRYDPNTGNRLPSKTDTTQGSPGEGMPMY